MSIFQLTLAFVASWTTAKDVNSLYGTASDSGVQASVLETKKNGPAPKLDSEAKQTCLMAGGMFQNCDDSRAWKSLATQSEKSFAGPIVSSSMRLAVEGLEKVIVKRAQAEAFEWIVDNALSDTSHSRMVNDLFPKTLVAAKSPGYRGVRANLLAIRTGFRSDLADIAGDPVKVFPLLRTLDSSNFKDFNTTYDEWMVIHSLLRQAQVLGYSGGNLAGVMGKSGDAFKPSVINAIFLSSQKDPQAIRSILMNQDNLKLVIDNIKFLMPESPDLNPQKLIQFLIHLEASSDLFRLRGDSAIRALPRVVALVQEGFEALGAKGPAFDENMRKAVAMAKAANLLMDRDVPGVARQLFSLKYPDKIPAKLEVFLGLLDALSESDTLAVATKMDQIIAPVGGWKGKYDGLTHLSVSSFAGVGAGAYYPTLDTPEGIYGPQIPIGVELGWKDPCGVLPSGIMASFLNLGYLMNVRGEEVPWDWKDVAAAGAYLKWQLGRSPFVLLLGGEYRRKTWSTIGTLGIDVTLFPIR